MALNSFSRQRSIHGRNLSLTSTGGLAVTADGSTDVGAVAQLWGPSHLETVTSSAATLRNYGVSVISTDVPNGSSLSVGPPFAGLKKEVVMQTTSSLVAFSAGGATFNSTSALGAAGGSTTISVSKAFLSGGMLELLGLSTSAWHIKAYTGVTVSS